MPAAVPSQPPTTSPLNRKLAVCLLRYTRNRAPCLGRDRNSGSNWPKTEEKNKCRELASKFKNNRTNWENVPLFQLSPPLRSTLRALQYTRNCMNRHKQENDVSSNSNDKKCRNNENNYKNCKKESPICLNGAFWTNKNRRFYIPRIYVGQGSY
jgi:hypothetical protein